MLGFTQYNPAILNLIIDRGRYYPIVVGEASKEENKRLAEFLDKKTERKKVLMVDTINLLKIYAKKYDLSSVQIIVFDTIINLSNTFLEVVDATSKEDGTYQYFSITPDIFNSTIEECTPGIPLVGISKKTKKKVAESLSIVLEKATKDLEKGKDAVIKRSIKCLLKISKQDKLKKLLIKYGISDKFDEIHDFIFSKKGKELKYAITDSLTFGTKPEIACKDSGANINDFMFICSFYPLKDKVYNSMGFFLPKKLTKKRRGGAINGKKD